MLRVMGRHSDKQKLALIITFPPNKRIRLAADLCSSKFQTSRVRSVLEARICGNIFLNCQGTLRWKALSLMYL